MFNLFDAEKHLDETYSVFMLLSLLRLSSVFFWTSSLVRLAPGIMTLAFVGTFSQHLMGMLLYETVWGMFVGKAPEVFRLLWSTVFWLYPFERAFIIVLATIIGVPLVKALRSAGFVSSSL